MLDTSNTLGARTEQRDDGINNLAYMAFHFPNVLVGFN